MWQGRGAWLLTLFEETGFAAGTVQPEQRMESEGKDGGAGEGGGREREGGGEGSPAEAGRVRAADADAEAAPAAPFPATAPACAALGAACRRLPVVEGRFERGALALRASVRAEENGRRGSARGGLTKADKGFFLH